MDVKLLIDCFKDATATVKVAEPVRTGMGKLHNYHIIFVTRLSIFEEHD